MIFVFRESNSLLLIISFLNKTLRISSIARQQAPDLSEGTPEVPVSPEPVDIPVKLEKVLESAEG